LTPHEEPRKLRPFFIFAGFAAGLSLSFWYLWLNHAGRSISGAPAPPDPAASQLVNVILIVFAAAFQGSLLGRVCDLLIGRMREKRLK
jgi:hypothetical protein